MTASRSDLDAILSALTALDNPSDRQQVTGALEIRRQLQIQDDTLQMERKRRDRVLVRRQKAVLFSKSEDLAHLEQLCRAVAGTLCDTSWNKLFVTDPDMVLASKLIKPQKGAAKKRAKKLRRARTQQFDAGYTEFVQPDTAPDAPDVYRKKAAKSKPPTDADDASAENEKKSKRPPLLRENTRFGDLRDRNVKIEDASTGSDSDSDQSAPKNKKTMEELRERLIKKIEKREKPKRVGHKLPADEQWPAWRAPLPVLPTGADQETLVDDQRYFDQFGAYLSETMFAATRDVVAEIRVQDTLSRHVKRIPIRRLVAEPLVSSWFAKWVATVILKNRALVGKTWHRVEIVQNIANQLEECRGFFRNPEQYGASAEMYSKTPVTGTGRVQFRKDVDGSSSSSSSGGSDDDDGGGGGSK